jgi:hypothetical protein
MKKILLILILFFGIIQLYAQNITDAMRFSQEDINGTARFSAMSGAFGALGGDLSAIGINPAGSVIFANNKAGVTFTVFNKNNDSNYFGTKTKDNLTSFDANQAGGVFIFKNQDSKWNKLALAINYDNTNNLDNSIFSAGVNSNSVANYFTSYANGIPFGNLTGFSYDQLFYNEQQAYLGYGAYIIDPATTNTNETQYYSNVPAGANHYQEYSNTSTGFNGKLSFNGAAQYGDTFSIGLNLNSHFVDYRQSTSFYEENDFVPTTTSYSVNRLRFNNDLYTYGTGFSFQVGTIFKPAKEIRLGLTYQSPTWYKLYDELSQNISAVSGNNAGELAPDIVDPQLTIIYEPYKLQTPSKYTGSFAYIFGNRGLISIDYSLKDYNNMQLKPNSDFLGTNNYIANVLKVSSEIRIGTEYKIEKWSLRGGYRFEESPYKNGKTIGDLFGVSGGLGYNFGNTKLDVAYAYSKRNYNQQYFSQGLTDYSNIYQINNNISVTLMFEL